MTNVKVDLHRTKDCWLILARRDERRLWVEVASMRSYAIADRFARELEADSKKRSEYINEARGCWSMTTEDQQ